MARQDRIAQLFSLLEEAEQNNDSDKIMEIKSDLFKEFGISKSMGGMMSMDEMTRPLSFQVGGPVGMTEQERMSSSPSRISPMQNKGDKEMMMEAFNTKLAKKLLDEAMKNTEAKRIESTDPNDPETFKTSTYGKITDEERLSVALQIARAEGDTSQENINKILKRLQNIYGEGTKEESVSFGKNREELDKIVQDMIPMEGIGGDLLRGIASGIGMPIIGGKKLMQDISKLIKKSD
tara:strand:- start:55 stop:762 length:708 start_codon:yes stop_codon:yes gene_type:complete